MRRFVRAFVGILLWSAVALAQPVPDRYVVELTGAPLGAEVRTKGRNALRDRVAAIQSEQARVTAVIEQRNGKVLSSLDSVMNALIVKITDMDASALSALPGVKQVYPVHWYKMDLDHGLPLHHVPDAWARIGGKDKAGAGIKVAILDTGVSPKHPAFQDTTLKSIATHRASHGFQFSFFDRLRYVSKPGHSPTFELSVSARLFLSQGRKFDVYAVDHRETG